MHRSGTSLTSSILNGMNINMGSFLNSKSKSNILGHYEDMDFLNLNQWFLKKSGGSWDNPYQLDPEFIDEAFIKNNISKIILSRNGNWGFKDPRTILLIDYYWEVLKNHNCHFIFVERSKSDIVKSLRTRQPENSVDFDRLTDYYQKKLKRFKNFLKSNNTQILTVKYNEMIENPFETCVSLAQYISKTSNHFISKKTIKAVSKNIFKRKKLEKVKKRILWGKRLKKMLNPASYYKIFIRTFTK